ncbi:katanin p60 ATPase-containing subunit A1 [Platysternon megacephalum]|uniref:Katanin p60 ATPase-containing subunit A1 n=1 Tax=Platysternon megacephalum TaxID=55544 RepID=A0A4D9EF50_9SAUR|nr:katanin p60 ATPase-containing subunit A1 [Platysternon megacephalum]
MVGRTAKGAATVHEAHSTIPASRATVQDGVAGRATEGSPGIYKGVDGDTMPDAAESEILAEILGCKMDRGDTAQSFHTEIVGLGYPLVEAGKPGAGGSDDAVILEQFLQTLPEVESVWVCCHQPSTLDNVVNLMEEFLEAYLPRRTIHPLRGQEMGRKTVDV